MADRIITRRQARVQGLKRYFTGKPCKRGHVTERQVSNLTCMECTNEKQRATFHLRDKDAERERLRLWREANREKVNAKSRDANATPERKAYKAAWFQANKERIRPARLALYEEQRADRIAYSRAWVAANQEKALEHARMHARLRRARKHGGGGTHTPSDLAEILASQSYRCAYCRTSLRRVKKHVDHIVPLARGGSNGRANVQFTCSACNHAKSAKDPIDYAQSIGLLL